MSNGRWERDSGYGRMPDDDLRSFSRQLLRQQLAAQPPKLLKETLERAIERARRWPNSYLAKEIKRIYGVQL